jgi:methionyl aminopeptidase
VHGLPGDRTLRRGDLVTLDVTAELNGYYADAAISIVIPPAPSLALALAACAEAAFRSGLRRVRAGVPLRAVGAAVEREVRRRGFHVLRDLGGHGIGRRIHEEPRVPNYGDPAARRRLTEGLVITLEPIVSESAGESRLLRDGWTVVSADGSLTAHYEHTLVVMRGAPLLLTAA